METLMDILRAGDEADAAGAPFVKNWRQARTGLQLLGLARPLETALVSDFDKLFVNKFEDMDAVFRNRLPSKRSYLIALREVRHILASQGYASDPWEALRALILSNAAFDMRLELLNGLKGPARRAGLAPVDITPQWVWSYDQALGVGNQRAVLRRGVVFFNRLFDYPEIVAAGLLPSSPLGTPPVYDSRGRAKRPLPAALKHVYAKAHEMMPLWQIISVQGQIGLPDNPTPDDLVKVWPEICQVDPNPYGLKPNSFRLYLQRVFKALTLHASPIEDPDQMPGWLMILPPKAPNAERRPFGGFGARSSLVTIPICAICLLPNCCRLIHGDSYGTRHRCTIPQILNVNLKAMPERLWSGWMRASRIPKCSLGRCGSLLHVSNFARRFSRPSTRLLPASICAHRGLC